VFRVGNSIPRAFCQSDTLLLIYITCVYIFRFVYYGVVLFVTRIYDKHSGDDDSGDDDGDTCDFNYQEIFISAASESVGVLLVAFVIDW
jgi:hypothetical protein